MQISYEVNHCHEDSQHAAWFFTELHTNGGHPRRAESWQIYASRGYLIASNGHEAPTAFAYQVATSPRETLDLLAVLSESNRIAQAVNATGVDSVYLWDADRALQDIHVASWLAGYEAQANLLVSERAGIIDDVLLAEERVYRKANLWANSPEAIVEVTSYETMLVALNPFRQTEQGYEIEWSDQFGLELRTRVVQASRAVHGLSKILR